MITVISVKLDKAVKESAQEVAHSAGLTLSALVNSVKNLKNNLAA